MFLLPPLGHVTGHLAGPTVVAPGKDTDPGQPDINRRGPGRAPLPAPLPAWPEAPQGPVTLCVTPSQMMLVPRHLALDDRGPDPAPQIWRNAWPGACWGAWPGAWPGAWCCAPGTVPDGTERGRDQSAVTCARRSVFKTLP